MNTRIQTFEDVRNDLPDPVVTSIGDGIELETLHIPGEGPPLVFIHGGLGSMWNHYLQLDHFAGNRELIAYSLVGYGQSSSQTVRSVSAHATHLRRLLTALDVENVVLNGWSYGAAVALEYAKRWSVEGLVLCSGADHALTPWWEPPVIRFAIATGLYKLFRGETVPKWFARSEIFHGSTPDPVVEQFLETLELPLQRSAWDVLESFWGYEKNDERHRITAPTLVVHGSEDSLVPIEAARRTAGRIPDAVFCEVQQAAHAVMVERPQTCNTLVETVFDCVEEDESLVPLVAGRVA
ncbi:alpha/beta hydrolase fold protein [Haloferax larsenii JCM 13917]|nr:alpha/beta hydrolase [Haloferax larsenii]ELZ79712.1 alpha/beta hydrolase fold protein [Haloferax larsenii JCM 13917]